MQLRHSLVVVVSIQAVLVGFAGGCTTRPDLGEEGGLCIRAEERLPDRTTIIRATCAPGLTCIEYDYECGLGPPFYPCQDEECLDCDNPDNTEICEAYADDDEDDEVDEPVAD